MSGRKTENLVGKTLRGENVYLLQQELGSGGFGKVFLGTRRRDNKQFAIKVLWEDRNKVAVAKFWKEARTIQKLSHPNIIALEEVDLDEREGLSYIVMPVASEGSLRRQAPQGHALSPLAVSTFIADAAEGLQHAHDHQIIHRDIKPANILLNNNRRASPAHLQLWVADFGVAAMDHTTPSQRTEPDTPGTPHYMAPEQSQGHPHRQSDQYSLAIVAYELLTGRVPFTGSNPVQIALAHINDLLPAFSQQGIRMNQQLEALEPVIRKGLEKTPQERYPTIRAFAQAFKSSLLLVGEDVRKQQARKWFEVGIAFSKGGKHQEALGAYEQILLLDAKNAAAQMGKARALRQLGRNDEAVKAFEEAERLDPTYVAAFVEKGAALQELGRNTEALQAYKQAQQLHPQNPALAAEVQQQVSLLEKQLPGFSQEKQKARLLMEEAKKLRMQGQYKAALQLLNDAVTLDPENPQILVLQGEMLWRKGKFDEALTALDKVIKIEPNNKDAYVQRGRTLLKMQRRIEAMKALDKALELDPMSAEAYTLIGEAMGRNEMAIKVYDKALELDPTNVEALDNKATTLVWLNRLDEAKALYEKAWETSNLHNQDMLTSELVIPGDKLQSEPQGEPGAEEVHAPLPQNETRRQENTGSLSAQPTETRKAELMLNIQALRKQGENEQDRSKYQAALERCEEALRQFPNESELFIEKGLCFVGLRQKLKASSEFDKAIRLNPKNGRAYVEQATLLMEEFGKPQDALAVLEEAEQQGVDFKAYRLVAESIKNTAKQLVANKIKQQ
jgi:tetratricopeptide (TPR) repeat protein/tRNA A-37 threonylcarbamoyl transferase component Bud32